MIVPKAREIQFSASLGKDGTLRHPVPRLRRRLPGPPELLPGARLLLRRSLPVRGVPQDEEGGATGAPRVGRGAEGSPGRGAGAAGEKKDRGPKRGGSNFREVDRGGTPRGRKRGARWRTGCFERPCPRSAAGRTRGCGSPVSFRAAWREGTGGLGVKSYHYSHRTLGDVPQPGRRGGRPLTMAGGRGKVEGCGSCTRPTGTSGAPCTARRCWRITCVQAHPPTPGLFR
jgi:hypothetical protein